MAAGTARSRRGLRAPGVAVVAGILLISLAACRSGSGVAQGAAQGAAQPGATQSVAAAVPAGPASAQSSSLPASASAETPVTRGTPGKPRATVPAHADPFTAAAAAAYVAQRNGTVLAAVYDLRTGQTWRLGDGPPEDEASVVKLDILQTLLAEWPGGLPSSEQSLAQRMIENSDNDAATSLWYAAGGASGLSAYNARVGLTRTTPSPCVECAGFPWPGWGLTTTVPADQLTLLRALIEPGPLLTAAARRYALSLMENVEPDQDWGVSGGVPAGVTVALKNGWLPLNDADTDWQINSVGWVSGDGRDYLIAVMSTGNPDEQYGIDTISELSAMVWSAMA